jgi:Holliday junction resolvase
MSERTFQSKVTRWLRDQGAYVIKTNAAPGVPAGCPDVIALYQEKWCAIECKAGPKSYTRPMQVHTLNHLREFCQLVYRAYPENWDTIKVELQTQFFHQ